LISNTFRGDEFQNSRLQRETVNFLFAFDAASSMERKNPEAVIDAFARAFKGTPHAARVCLTLKIACVQRREFSVAVERLWSRAAQAGVAVRVDDRHLDRAEMLKLIASADCYVSLHRSEGFGYTMAEAMYYGVPVIASGYSGNLQYMSAENSFLVPCQEVFVSNAEGPFQRGSIWGEPDIDIAAELMRKVVEIPGQALATAERGRKTVLEKLGAGAVSELLAPYFLTSSGSDTSRLPGSM
jgi:glycosyltransferase involved in cell wall biosynthesis